MFVTKMPYFRSSERERERERAAYVQTCSPSIYHFNRLKYRDSFWNTGWQRKNEWRDPVHDAQDTHGNALSLNAVLDRYLNSSMVIQKFSAKTNKWYQLKEKL